MYFDIYKKGEVRRCGETEKMIYEFLTTMTLTGCGMNEEQTDWAAKKVSQGACLLRPSRIQRSHLTKRFSFTMNEKTCYIVQQGKRFCTL